MTSRRSPHFGLSRRLAAEGFGTLFLVATVVGSGIMAARLTADTAVALLANAVATGAMLTVLITIFGPISGAHLNPAVSVVFALKGGMSRVAAAYYAITQVAGGIAGTILAHAMFGLPAVTLSRHIRTGGGQWLAELVASFGLMVTVLLGRRLAPGSVAWLVGLYITAAYWFTASTSFANPAVAIARSLTNSFSGIRPADVPAFILAQLAGAVAALVVADWLLAPAGEAATSGTGV